jgi:circadian clock protein KaiB
MEKTKPKINAIDSFEKASGPQGSEHYVLRLYTTGSTPRSLRSIANIKSICEEHLKGHYELEVIDIYQDQTLVAGDQIIATPTLIKKLPLPLRKIIGDLSDKEKVLLGLDLKTKK